MYYRLIISTGVLTEEDAPYCMDFWSKENAINAARFYMDLALNGSEPVAWLEVYEMHPDENRSFSVLDFNFQ